MMTKRLQKIQISDDRLEYYLNGQITCCASASLYIKKKFHACGASRFAAK